MTPHRVGAGIKRPEDLAPLARERRAFADDLDALWGSQAEQLHAALEQQKSKRHTKALPSVDELLDWDSEREKLVRLLRGRSRRVAEAAAWDILTQYNPDADGWSADALDAWLAKAAQTNADEWEAGLRERLLGLLTSESWQDSVTEIPTWAIAGVFAITWATQYAGFGRHDAAKASRLGTKTWHTSSKHPRATHAALEGETTGIDDVFGNGLRYPGDPAVRNPAETANCECYLTYGKGEA